MQNKAKPVVPTILLNNSLPTLYIDGLQMSKRRDEVNLIRFTTGLPEGRTEQVRLIVDNEHLRRIIDVLCRANNYYPKKPVKQQNRQE